jgi:hypothetical protein
MTALCVHWSWLAGITTEDGAEVRCHDEGYSNWFRRFSTKGGVGRVMKILLVVVLRANEQVVQIVKTRFL